MAKQRMVNTRFWDDDYTSNLDPIEKLLFLYFLTNTSTNICGVYEIPLKKVANETGIDKEMVAKIIQRFTNDNKIFYQDGWVVVKNFIKHQNQKSPKVSKGIVEELKNVPEQILTTLNIGQIDYEENPSLSKRQAVLIRDKFTCKYCEEEIKDNTYELDHIFPKSKGGNELYTNIALACRTCNQTKLDRTDEEFIGRKIIVESYHAEKALNELRGNENYIHKMKNIHPEFSLDVKTITNKYPISTLSHSNTNINSNPNSNPNLNTNTIKKESIDSFEEFWKSYPKKTSKKLCSDLWKKHKLTSQLKDILSFIEKAKESDRWKKGFVKNPETFIRQETWKDDINAYNDIKKDESIIRI
jgi:hypothetical protein